jgi:enoyl-CoA hydratase
MGDRDLLKIERQGHIAWLTLNRPEKRNALNMAFFPKLLERITQLDKDPEVRVVVIKAEGRSFSVGMDLGEASSGDLFKVGSVADRERLRRKIIEMQEYVNIIEMCRKPVIAAVHGHCLGGGLDIITACDIRIASTDAIFSIAETRIAIIADMGTLQRLPAIIGQGWFRELALTGRFFTADEALQMGLVTRICENRDKLNEEAGKLAEEIAANSPLTVQGTKDVMNYTRDNGVYPGLEYTAQKNAAMLVSEDLREAFQAFMEKRPPKFRGR